MKPLRLSAALPVVALLWSSLSSAQPLPGTVLWTYAVGEQSLSSPALGSGGVTYLATLSGLQAITNTASLASNKWSFNIPISSSSPVVGPDNTAYICSADGNLYAIDSEGRKKWSYPVDGSEGSAAIDFNGTILVQGKSYLYAFSSAGILEWRSWIASSPPYSSPIIGPDETIYVPTSSQLFYAFNPDGTQKWMSGLQSAGGDSGAIGEARGIYVTGGSLFCFNPDGSLVFGGGEALQGSPVVGRGGTVYVRGTTSHELYALTPAGEVLWHLLGDGARYNLPTSPVLGKDGSIYFCASNSVWCLTSQGEVRWKLYGGYTSPPVYLAQTSPVLAPDGTLYALLGQLYAIATDSGGPADSPWPMYRGNAQHTGRIQKPSLQNPKKRADANFEFQLFSQTGTSVSVESSTNLTTWNTLTSVVPTIAPEPIVDLTASNSPVKFYRAKGGG